MEIKVKELADFLIKAKINSYAGSKKSSKSQRPNFNEMKFKMGKWEYRDSYTGFFSAPGQEVVRYNKKPIWVMSYSGGMDKKYWGDTSFSLNIFNFLKKALLKIPKKYPFRGPNKFSQGEFIYLNSYKGDIKRFHGQENISYKGNIVFSQDYIGGLVIYN